MSRGFDIFRGRSSRLVEADHDGVLGASGDWQVPRTGCVDPARRICGMGVVSTDPERLEHCEVVRRTSPAHQAGHRGGEAAEPGRRAVASADRALATLSLATGDQPADNPSSQRFRRR